MPRSPSRLLVPALALIAIVFLFPAFATALPPGEAVLSTVEHPEAGPGLFSRIWSLFSVLWDDTGSPLQPNGTESGEGSGNEPNQGSTGNTGSGLDPNG